jgi:hypothetical protein
MKTTHPQGTLRNKSYDSNKFKHESPCFSTAPGTAGPPTEIPTGCLWQTQLGSTQLDLGCPYRRRMLLYQSVSLPFKAPENGPAEDRGNQRKNTQ